MDVTGMGEVAHVSRSGQRRQGEPDGLREDRAKKNPAAVAAGFWGKTLAMTYSRMLDAHYHWRVCVSLPSSEWDRVEHFQYYPHIKNKKECMYKNKTINC